MITYQTLGKSICNLYYRYWRAINFTISPEKRHRSGVHCDFRPVPDFYSETAWIFPRQARQTFNSILEKEHLVDGFWYTSQVNLDSSQCADDWCNSDELTSVEDGSECTEDENQKLVIQTNNNYLVNKGDTWQKMDDH